MRLLQLRDAIVLTIILRAIIIELGSQVMMGGREGGREGGTNDMREGVRYSQVA